VDSCWHLVFERERIHERRIHERLNGSAGASLSWALVLQFSQMLCIRAVS
jgi:hypothetical protein